MHDRDLSEWDETEIANTSFGMCTLLMGSSVFGIDAPRRGRVRSNVLSKHFFSTSFLLLTGRSACIVVRMTP